MKRRERIIDFSYSLVPRRRDKFTGHGFIKDSEKTVGLYASL